MNFPTDLKYTNDHEWVRFEGQFAYVGITEFAQRELGDIVFVDVPTVGKAIAHGESFGTVEAVKTVSDLFMPITGKVVQVNEDLESSPEVINTDPYGEGWIIKLEIAQPKQTENLLSASEYKTLVDS